MKTKYAAVIHLKTNSDILSGFLFDSRSEARSWARGKEGARGIYGFTIIKVHVR